MERRGGGGAGDIGSYEKLRQVWERAWSNAEKWNTRSVFSVEAGTPPNLLLHLISMLVTSAARRRLPPSSATVVQEHARKDGDKYAIRDNRLALERGEGGETLPQLRLQ